MNYRFWPLQQIFFSCPEQLNGWPCLSLAWAPLTIRVFTTLQSDPRDLWPLRHLIRVMKGHDLTNKKTMTNTNTWTMTMTKTNTFWEHLQRATLETCDLWDIWSEWWGDMTWPTKIQWQIQIQRQRHSQSQRLVTFETLITILTIKNLNSWQSLLPDN